jgi:hypothetical protein
MSSILDLIAGAKDIPPEVLAPKGDYQLRIRGVWYKQNEETGNKGLSVSLEFVEYPNYSEFFDNLNLPMADDSEGLLNKKLRRIEEFNSCFGITPDMWEELGPLYEGEEKGQIEKLTGLIGWAAIDKDKDRNGVLVNKIKGSPFNLGGYLKRR